MVGKASISPTTKGDDQASTGPVEKGDDQTSTGPKYTDADQLGIRFIICLLLYTALIFGAELGFSSLWKVVGQNIIPIGKVCDCPVNAETYGQGTVYYSGCVDSSSEEFKTLNAVSKNQSITVQGWFFETSFTRENLEDKRAEAYGTVAVKRDESIEPPYLYNCPVFRPFWWAPVDWVGTIILIVSQLFMVLSVATSFIVKTEVYHDRVEVTYYGGNRLLAPLYAIQGEVKSHKLKGCLPIRENALSLTTTETVEVPSGSVGGGKSTVLIGKTKDGNDKLVDFRVEPTDPETFKSALAAARDAYAMDAKPPHFYYNEMPVSARHITLVQEGAVEDGETDKVGKNTAYATENENVIREWAARNTCDYWCHASWLLVLYMLMLHFGFRFLLYAMKEFLDPNRPRLENEFSRQMWTFEVDSIFVLAMTAFYLAASFVNGLPTKSVITNDALYFLFDRVSKMNTNIADMFNAGKCSLIVPRNGIVTAQLWGELECIERAIWYIFTEMGTPQVMVTHYYTTIQNNETLVVSKQCAKDTEKGLELDPGFLNWQFMVPGSTEEQGKIIHGLKVE